MEEKYLNYNSKKFDFSSFFKNNQSVKNISHYIGKFSKDIIKKKKLRRLKKIKDLLELIKILLKLKYRNYLNTR